MATKPNKMSLTPRQEIAMSEILAGKTDRETAKVVGVSRETVSKWRHHSPVFQAEYNLRRKQIWDANREHLASLIARALGVIEKALEMGDASVALRILRCAKGLNTIECPDGPTDVADVLRELARERAEQELASTRREESKGQLFITDPIADIEELAPLIKKHFSILKEKYGMR